MIEVTLSGILISVGKHIAIGAPVFFLDYYINKRWPQVFTTHKWFSDNLNSEFIGVSLIWPLVVLVDILTVIKYFYNKLFNYSPIENLCGRIDKVVDKQHGKLDKDIIVKFKME